MKTKSKRLSAIRRIITTEKIASQEELAAHLKRRGYRVTQSTLSRDLKELNVAKSTGKGESGIYFIPDTPEGESVAQSERGGHGLLNSIKRIDFSGNIAIIKTSAGYANAVASIIDGASTDSILGTVAGDDTLFIVISEEGSREELVDELSPLFPNIKRLVSL